MRAISSFRREVGISACSCIALLALRMRVSMSATGSVSIARLLPAGLRHARDHALVRELPQADPAEAELAEDGARPPTAVAARVVAGLELLRHLAFPPAVVTGKWHAQRGEQRARLLVVLGRRRDRHVEAANLLDVVVV